MCTKRDCCRSLTLSMRSIHSKFQSNIQKQIQKMSIKTMSKRMQTWPVWLLKMNDLSLSLKFYNVKSVSKILYLNLCIEKLQTETQNLLEDCTALTKNRKDLRRTYETVTSHITKMKDLTKEMKQSIKVIQNDTEWVMTWCTNDFSANCKNLNHISHSYHFWA